MSQQRIEVLAGRFDTERAALAIDPWFNKGHVPFATPATRLHEVHLGSMTAAIRGRRIETSVPDRITTIVGANSAITFLYLQHSEQSPPSYPTGIDIFSQGKFTSIDPQRTTIVRGQESVTMVHQEDQFPTEPPSYIVFCATPKVSFIQRDTVDGLLRDLEGSPYDLYVAKAIFVGSSTDEES